MKQIWSDKAGLAGVSLVALMLAAPAHAEIKPSVDLEARLGYDANPFLETGNDLASGYAEISVRPKLTAAGAKGQTVLSGHYDRTEYQHFYDHTDQYGAALESQQKLSAKLNVFGALRYDRNVVGQNDAVVGTAPINNTDLNLLGTRQRVNTYAGSAGFGYALSPKDTFTANGGYTATRYVGNSFGSDNNNFGGQLGYQRAISARTKIGVSGSAYKIDYDTPGLYSLVMQPNVTFSTELSPKWHFDGSVGVSFIDNHLPNGTRDKSTGFAGQINLCHTGSRNTFCVFGSRSVSGSGFGGTAEQTQGGFNFNQKLSEKLSFDAGGSYARSVSLSGLAPTREYVSGHVGLKDRLTRRLTVGVQGQYRDVFGYRDALGNGVPVKADFGGEISATLALPGPK